MKKFEYIDNNTIRCTEAVQQNITTNFDVEELRKEKMIIEARLKIINEVLNYADGTSPPSRN